jgi:hypothetical protein
MKLLLIFSFIFSEFLCAQSPLELALEDFVGNDQGIASNSTTDASADSDVEYIVLDVDGDGTAEIFVSRSDLKSDSIWIFYRDHYDSKGGVEKVGVVELESSTMRISERDGRKGYYELYHMGAGQARLVFNSIDNEGQLVAFWESVVEQDGEYRELLASLHFGRFDKNAKTPKIEVVASAPIRESFQRRKLAKYMDEKGSRNNRLIAELPTDEGARRNSSKLVDTVHPEGTGPEKLISRKSVLFAGFTCLVFLGSVYYWFRTRISQ